MPIPIVRPVQFPDEAKPVSRAVALDGPVLVAGATARILRERHWLRCRIDRVEFSTVYARQPDAA
jgi:hypothetical protein